MMNLIFQKAKAKDPTKVRVDSRRFFDNNVVSNEKCFNDPFIQDIIKTVDGATVVQGPILKSREGKIMPPQWLSTGAKTAICIYLYPDWVFNATQMGDNAFQFVIELCRKHDRTVLTYRYLPYKYMIMLDLQKDYKPVTFEDDEDFWDHFDEWMEEMYND